MTDPGPRHRLTTWYCRSFHLMAMIPVGQDGNTAKLFSTGFSSSSSFCLPPTSPRLAFRLHRFLSRFFSSFRKSSAWFSSIFKQRLVRARNSSLSSPSARPGSGLGMTGSGLASRLGVLLRSGMENVAFNPIGVDCLRRSVTVTAGIGGLGRRCLVVML